MSDDLAAQILASLQLRRKVQALRLKVPLGFSQSVIYRKELLEMYFSSVSCICVSAHTSGPVSRNDE